MLPSGPSLAVVSPTTSVPVAPVPAKFLKGQLVTVDCSTPPGAVLTVVAGGKTWKFHSADGGHMIVIGAQNLSCAWTNQKVAINYRETADGTGDIISLEIQ